MRIAGRYFSALAKSDQTSRLNDPTRNRNAMTTQPRFIQIHTLHTYPAALINRDDAGLAKRLPLGNAMRTRISSQCLKRHWRIADDRFALSGWRFRWQFARVAREIAETLIRQRIVSKCRIIAEPRGARPSGEASARWRPWSIRPARRKRREKMRSKTGQAVLMGKAEDRLIWSSGASHLAQEICRGWRAADFQENGRAQDAQRRRSRISPRSSMAAAWSPRCSVGW